MKKIVGLLAAAAVLATSVFAADVAAKVRITGKIFDYVTGGSYNADTGALEGAPVNEKGDEAAEFRLLSAWTQSVWYEAPYITLSTSTDNAGANVNFITGYNASKAVSVDRVNVWFKPIDLLKVQAGTIGFNMNTETIDYSNISGMAKDFGYALDIAQDAITFDLGLGTDNNGWFFEDAQAKYGTKEDPATAYVKDLYAIFGYSADFGTIKAFFEYQGKSVDGIKEAMAATPDLTKLKYNPTTIKFGAGYANTIDSLSFFVDVVGTSKSAATDKEMDLAKLYALTAGKAMPGIVTDKDGKARSVFGLAFDAFAAYSADALTVKGYVKGDIADFGHLTLKDGEMKEDIMADNNFSLGLKLRADYKLDNGIGLYAYFNNANLLRKEVQGTDTDPTSVFVSTIKLGASGSVGIASWETALQLDTGKVGGKDAKYNKVNVSMPVWVQVAF